MTSLAPLLLLLLLLVAAASAASSNYRSYGGSVAFTSKGRNADGTYEVELRQRNTPYYYHHSNVDGTCWSGNCGTQTQRSVESVSSGSYGVTWRQYEVTTNRQLTSNLPFDMRYPYRYEYYWGYGYWIQNVRGINLGWRMMTHVDMGIRSDTGESNRPPAIITPHLIRVPRNCPRTFNIPTFDPDGDNVRCRIPTTPATYECALCGLVNGFSFDQNSCSLTYNPGQSSGYYPVELVVEDFPNKDITLSYSDGSYTIKWPQTMTRRKRQAILTTTSAPTTTTFPLTTTTSAPTTTSFPLTTTTSPQTNTPSAPTTTTFSPTTTTSPQTNTPSAPTTTTFSPTTTTSPQTNTPSAPTTTTFSPTTTTSP
ncbi:PREDICTED: uncharacterized protein PB18E9.04c-like, partial [Cyprinodon variegatus]|uniref:uncharacterized protein PB18E9.04c-like n=1 Tax=Cyprinodon variegatus TaxID=28743 RepID=UPI000742BE4E